MQFIAFDIETGGLEIERPITEIAAVAFDGEHIIDSMHRRIRVRVDDCDPEALKINGYDADIWDVTAVGESYAIKEFCLFCIKHASVSKISAKSIPYLAARLAGHNALTFDWPRIEARIKKYNCYLPIHYPILDSYQLAAWLMPNHDKPDLQLGKLCELFGIEAGNHQALPDTIATGKLIHALLQEMTIRYLQEIK